MVVLLFVAPVSLVAPKYCGDSVMSHGRAVQLPEMAKSVRIIPKIDILVSVLG